MKNLFFLAQPAQTKQPIFGRHQLSFKLIPTPPLRPTDPRDGIASKNTCFMMKHKRTIFEFYILACQSKYILCFGAEPGPLFD